MYHVGSLLSLSLHNAVQYNVAYLFSSCISSVFLAEEPGLAGGDVTFSLDLVVK